MNMNSHLKSIDVKILIGFEWIWTRTAGFCEHGNELSNLQRSS